jgi:hypothetical protein
MCNKDETQAISNSSDTNGIIRDIKWGVFIMALFESTIFFRDAIIHPKDSHYLTCGTHKNLTYWDAFDASATFAKDRLLRLWNCNDQHDFYIVIVMILMY